MMNEDAGWKEYTEKGTGHTREKSITSTEMS